MTKGCKNKTRRIQVPSFFSLARRDAGAEDRKCGASPASFALPSMNHMVNGASIGKGLVGKQLASHDCIFKTNKKQGMVD
jgi:hypothetical protein